MPNDFIGRTVPAESGDACGAWTQHKLEGPGLAKLGAEADGVGENLQLFARQGLVLLGALLGVALEELGQGLLDAQPGVLVLVPGAVFGVEGGVEVVVVVAVKGRLRLEVLGRQDGVDRLLARVLGGVLLGVSFALVGGAGLVLQPARGGDGRRAGDN
ncbi:uncharacterized protein PG986_010644 [Apiospora aurea]|uniref:Uncharacterized protein n=1 Tax=Apiospora aurea TaxID=335848 RepID=A0ABR1Q2U1_9PEZI